MQFIPYLNFDGNCAEAMIFYAKLFGGQITQQMTFGEIPPSEGMPPMPDASRNRIMHARLEIGQQVLMASDAMPSTPESASEICAGGYLKPQGMWVSIAVASAPEGQRLFDALAQGGQVAMPYAPTFWSPGFGMVTDRFGTPWMLNAQA